MNIDIFSQKITPYMWGVAKINQHIFLTVFFGLKLSVFRHFIQKEYPTWLWTKPGAASPIYGWVARWSPEFVGAFHTPNHTYPHIHSPYYNYY
jgi:hypothetical protein